VRFRPRQLGLRARILIAFTLGTFVLSFLLSASTWGFTRQSQLNQREDLAIARFFGNAGIVRNRLLNVGAGVDVQQLLASLPASSPVLILRVDGETRPVNPGLRFTDQDLPVSLRTSVDEGSAAIMRYRVREEPVLALGMPLPAIDGEYFEIVSLVDVESSLSILAAYLIAASLATTAAGAALGWWASGRTLRPLTDVGRAAQAIAGGRLDTRLDGSDDPDLAALVSSFNEMGRALQERIERDARFASDVSHELRSPLMTLAASVEVLETRRDDLPERSRAALDLLSEDVRRFQALVADLLEISRFDAGAVQLDLEPVSAPEFIRQALRAATDRPVPVYVIGDPEELVVDLDKRRMARVIANLVDNADKYGGGVEGAGVRPVPGGVEIAVEDRGPGIPVEDRTRVFERFSRGGAAAGSRGIHSGVGLGLSLVAEHVRLHGGTVRVESRLDGETGARFVIELPPHDPALDDEELETSLDAPLVPRVGDDLAITAATDDAEAEAGVGPRAHGTLS